MKRTILLSLLVFSTSSFAGICQLKFSSRESSKLQWVEGLTEKHNGVSLEACVGRGEALIGSRALFKGSLVRPEAVRLITQGSYEFSGANVSASGNISLKH